MTATDDSAGRQERPGLAQVPPHGGLGYDAYGRPVHPGWAGQPSPYERPRPRKVPLPRAPAWLPMAVVGVGVVAALLATLNRPGLGLVVTGVVAGLTALAALMVRPAIPESGVPPEESCDEDVAPSTAPPPGRAVAESSAAPRVHATIPPVAAADEGPGADAPTDGALPEDHESAAASIGEPVRSAGTDEAPEARETPQEGTSATDGPRDPESGEASDDHEAAAKGGSPGSQEEEGTPAEILDSQTETEHEGEAEAPGTDTGRSNRTDPHEEGPAEPEAHPRPSDVGAQEERGPGDAAPGRGAEPAHGRTWPGPQDHQARPGHPGHPGRPDHPQPGQQADPGHPHPDHTAPAAQSRAAHPSHMGYSGHKGHDDHQGYTGHSAHAAAASWGYANHPGHYYGYAAPVPQGHPGHHHPGHAHSAYSGHPGYAHPAYPADANHVAPPAPARPDRYAYTWSAVFGVLSVALLATAALRDAGWVLVWTLTGSFLLASMAFATRNPAARQNAVGVATGAFALMRNVPATPRFLLSPLNTKRASGLALPIVVTLMVTVGLLLVFGLLFALADPVFATYLGRMFTSVGTGSGVLRLFGMLVTVLLTGAAVLTARRHHHRPRPRPVAPAADPLWPVWVWTVPLCALVALFVAFVGVQAAVMFGGDDYVQRVSGVIYAEYARQGFFQLVVVSLLVLGVIAVAVRLLPSRVTSTLTLRNALLGLLCVLTLIILASAMMRLQLYIDAFGLTRLRVSAEAWILWSAGVFGLVIVAGLCNTLGRSAAWLPRVTVAFGAAALAVFAYGNPDLRIAESHHDLDLAAVDTHYLSTLSADAVPGLMGLSEHDRTCALVGLRERLDDPDGRGVAAWNLSRVQGREQLAELGLFNDVSGLDCGVRDYVEW